MQKISITKIDLTIFNVVNGFAKKSSSLDFFGIFCAKYLGYGLFSYLILFAYVNKNWQIFLVPLIAGLIARLFINEIVYFFYKRKRPMEVMTTKVLIQKPLNPSFPSSHAAFFFALSLTLFLFNFQVTIIFLVASVFISFARIFCGLHWPSDIIGGICSALVSFLIILLMI